MGEGKPGTEAHTNVSQDTINDQAQWNTGTPKNPGDPATQGIYPDVSDENADAGATTSTAQQTSATTDPRAAQPGGPDANPSTYGGMKDGLPASGAATNPDKTVDGDQGA
ncbi:hypothetical protein HNQ07_000075 [Deinococcus metalli]|uniref:Uncharacterized protein n=1 Tax=Deinococcus metalli TaxID=1141878 RepID=A0A7W8NMF4_9DEIO|nr:hypothetical protein [Deinococcus metalli]MBB5374631.1 hypothetical protein [Deinococcus metalli]GHF34873.1 hypothetical protein GCM10017781_09660 [Deinococcus metalli]